jgi:hypothetical protein
MNGFALTKDEAQRIAANIAKLGFQNDRRP